MEIMTSLLLNIVYGFIFFLAFAVFAVTVVAFAVATWQTIGRLVRREATSAEGVHTADGSQ